MKKTLKIIGITLLSLLGLGITAAIVLCWIVFTPARITPIVRNVLQKQLTCETNLDTVDLTFFSTFPQFGLHLHNVTLLNPMSGAQSDTLIHLNHCTASINMRAFIKDKSIIINKLHIKDGVANVYIDSIGNGNFNIVPPNNEPDTTAFKIPFDVMQVEGVRINDLRASYRNARDHMDANIERIGLSLSANLKNKDGNADLELEMNDAQFSITDSTQLLATTPSLRFNADLNKINSNIKGNLNLQIPHLNFTMDSVVYATDKSVALNMPLEAEVDSMRLTLHKAELDLANHQLTIDGWSALDSNNKIRIDAYMQSKEWDIESVLSLVPNAYQNLLKDIKATGKMRIASTIHGLIADSLLPQIDAQVWLNNATVKYASLPYLFTDVQGDIETALKLNNGEVSSAKINNVSLKTRNSKVSGNGTINDLLGKQRCNVNLNIDVNLPDAKPMLPKDLNADLKGRAKGRLTGTFLLDDLLCMNLQKMRANGNLNIKDLYVAYNDSIFAQSPYMEIALQLPNKHKNNHFPEILEARIKAAQLESNKLGMATATLTGTDATIGLSNFMDDRKPLCLHADFNLDKAQANIDTIAVNITHPRGSVAFYPEKNNRHNTVYAINYSSTNIDARIGSTLSAQTGRIDINGQAVYDSTKHDILNGWDPDIDVNFNSGNLKISQLTLPIYIPNVNFRFTPDHFDIRKSQIRIGNSDFNLSGLVTNISKWIDNKGFLTADMDFISNTTDVYQLMDLVNGLGGDSLETAEAQHGEVEHAEDHPFMVPWNVDVTLKTAVKKAIVGSTDIYNVAGKLRVKDGILVLDQMGFTCDAATMQLTAMYRSERKNHLFCGLDFHLLNIDIDKLIDMIPEIDTIVPMLASFKGEAEFHLAAETYMKSDYSLKYSTMRGAAAISGKNLVLMDNATFSKIAKLLLFKKKTDNLVDSLSVELTLFRNEVELYPFLIAMDKYQAVVGGQYNLDQRYNAHIETLKPIRLGVEIKGTPANMNFKLVRTKYANMYKPEKRNATQARTLELKKMIADALKANVKDPSYYK